MKPGCSGHWTCGSRRGRGVAVTIQKEGFLHGESYRELANKLASNRAKKQKEGGGGGGDGGGRGGDSFSQA